MRWLDSFTDSVDMNLSKLWEIMKDRKDWYTPVHGVAKSQTQLSDQQKFLLCVIDDITQISPCENVNEK